MTLFKYKLPTAALVIALSGFPLLQGYASNKVSSPEVTKGKMEFEYRGGEDLDDRSSKDHKGLHKLVINYGITDRLRPEIKGILADNPGDDLKFTNIETSLRWQFLKKDEAWFAAALEGNYKFATQDYKADRFETKLLLGKDIGLFSSVANISMEQELGSHRTSGTAVFASWKTKYKLTTYFEPGIEWYSEFGKVGNGIAYRDQTHLFGPVISGKLTEKLKYEVGYLFGASHNAPDGRAKLLLTWGIQF